VHFEAHANLADRDDGCDDRTMVKETPRNRDLATWLARGVAALGAGRHDEAIDCARRALAIDARAAQAHFLVGLIAVERRDFRTAASAFGSVTEIDATHAAAWAQLARAWLMQGALGEAQAALSRAAALETNDPGVHDLIGAVHSQLGDQRAALAAFDRAAETLPDHAPFALNRANALIFLGRAREAAAVLGRVLANDPTEPQAHWLLATARSADPEHLATLERLLTEPHDDRATAFLAYAAGKLYEDLERWPEAFAAYARGAEAKRRTIDYDDADDAAVFRALDETFTPAWCAAPAAGVDDAAPIFIVGQPRTGTTLIERIVTSHSAVHSAGELAQFRLALRRLARVSSRAQPIMPGQLSVDVVRAAADVDPVALGTAYLRGCAPVRGRRAHFVDKLPANFLLVPLIARALPRAKIVHVVREPIDSCFACYKQLFADAYPHSYDQVEMARHYARYRQSMSAWRARLPGRIVDVRYEDAVRDLDGTARRLIAALGLPWEDACRDFHLADRPVATASALQVREPAHARSVGRWRRFERELAPTIATLREAKLVD